MTLLFAVIISAILLFSNQNIQINQLRSLTLESAGLLLEWTHYFQKLKTVRAENEQLRREVSYLTQQVFLAAEASDQNVQLRQLHELKQCTPTPSITANIIGSGFTNNPHIFFIDRGQDDGLCLNMPVFSVDGLVGKVTVVSAHRAQVTTFLNPYFRVSAMIGGLRVPGILKPTTASLCCLDNVAVDRSIPIGSVVVTSGQSMLFPKGIPIGKIIHVSYPQNELFSKIIVQPFTDFEKLEYVLVMVYHASAGELWK